MFMVITIKGFNQGFNYIYSILKIIRRELFKDLQFTIIFI